MPSARWWTVWRPLPTTVPDGPGGWAILHYAEPNPVRPVVSVQAPTQAAAAMLARDVCPWARLSAATMQVVPSGPA